MFFFISSSNFYCSTINCLVFIPINISYNALPNNFDNFALSSAAKVIGALSFALGILKVALSAPVLLALASTAAEVNAQFSIHLNESSTLQLISGISNDLQKLLKYFSDAASFTPFLSHLFQYYQSDLFYT